MPTREQLAELMLAQEGVMPPELAATPKQPLPPEMTLPPVPERPNMFERAMPPAYDPLSRTQQQIGGAAFGMTGMGSIADMIDAYGARDPVGFGVAAASLTPVGKIAGKGAKAAERVAGFAPDKSVMGDLFDYSKIHSIPDVKQFDLPRYVPPRGVSERVEKVVGNKKVQQQMLDLMEKGKGIKAETFYYNEPLREAFVSELGKKKGQTEFARYMDYVAGTSPRSDVETNARNASYYYWLEKQGLPVPGKGGVNPQPYGHMAQNLHRENASKIRSGEYFDYINNPKPMSFSQNLQGNFAPVTVDAHAFKLPGMLSRDPRFLAGSLKLEKGEPTINPTKMYQSGELPMKEALQRPVLWASRPNPNEYAAMEQYYKMLSREAELAPGQGQAAAWAGGGGITGLGSVAGDPFMRAVENRAIKTAAERGLTPAEALSQMMRGKAPLLGLGGAAAVGALAKQDEYQQ